MNRRMNRMNVQQWGVRTLTTVGLALLLDTQEGLWKATIVAAIILWCYFQATLDYKGWYWGKH